MSIWQYISHWNGICQGNGRHKSYGDNIQIAGKLIVQRGIADRPNVHRVPSNKFYSLWESKPDLKELRIPQVCLIVVSMTTSRLRQHPFAEASPPQKGKLMQNRNEPPSVFSPHK